MGGTGSAAVRTWRVLVAVGLAGTACLAVATPAAAATTVVTAQSLAGWSVVTNHAADRPYSAANVNPASTARFAFVQGPPGQPAGTGSLQMAVGPEPNSRISALAPSLVGETLDSITSMSYSTFGTHGGAGNVPQPPNLKFSVVTAAFGFRTLVFEPARPTQTPRPVLNAWQTWNPMTGLWWVNAFPNTSPCGQSNPCPFDQFKTAVGGSTQVGEAYFEMGDSATGFSGAAEFLDNVEFNGAFFDFEPTAGPPPNIPEIVDETPVVTEKAPTVAPGAQQVITATGFLAGEEVILTVNSPTLTLGPEVADQTGTVTFRFTVPADFPTGTHRAVLRGAVSGRELAIAFAVKPQLPVTGALPRWLLPTGGTLLCLGLLLLVATRVRTGRRGLPLRTP